MVYIAVTEIASLASVHGRYEMASLLLSEGTDL